MQKIFIFLRTKMGLNLDGIEKLRWGQVSFIFEERQKKQGNHKMHTLLFRFKNCKSVTNFSETHEFNNNSLKANWILLISGDYSTIFTESEVNNCFSIIAQMLSNFVANLICCWNHSVTIVLITGIKMSSQISLEFYRRI